LLRDVQAGHPLTWADVQMDTGLAAYQVRKEMEAVFQ
jgi:predicted homoserine dehydrogenase-like protein